MARTCEVCGDELPTDAEYQRHVVQAHGILEAVAALRQATRGHHWRDWLVAFTGVVALGIAAGSSWSTYNYAKKAEDRVVSQEERQFASRVYLGEVPLSFYDDHPEYPIPTFAVHNPSAIELRDAWIRGREGKAVRVQGIQSCTFYTPPPILEDGTEFEPVELYFRDPYGSWRYRVDGGLDSNYEPWDEDRASDGYPRADDIENCG